MARLYQAYEYIRITALPAKPRRKTRVYEVGSLSSDTCLGVIKWHGAWRQYCFFPAAETLWSRGCLADVIDFLERLKTERAEVRAGYKGKK